MNNFESNRKLLKYNLANSFFYLRDNFNVITLFLLAIDLQE
jgi:hypothetical protein